MKNFFLALTLIAFSVGCVAQEPASNSIRLEAEKGQFFGVNASKSRPGYSGTGYVTSFNNENDTVKWVIPNATAGIHTVSLRYSTDMPKGFGVIVNGVQTDGMFPNSNDKFAIYDLGKIELKSGANTVSIAKGWGWYDLD
ncbi:MAG: hypothetical protein EOO68_37495, partial [Moraxellaceae bacterium]